MKNTFHGDRDGYESKPSEPMRYRCHATGCPMPGSVFLNGHDADGICSMHFGCKPSEMGRITRTLQDWECVTFVLETCRRFLTDQDRAGDVKAEKTLVDAQWVELARMAPQWPHLAPNPGATMSDWARQLTAFLRWRIACDVQGLDAEWPPVSTQTVARMRESVRLRQADPDETPLSEAEQWVAIRDGVKCG